MKMGKSRKKKVKSEAWSGMAQHSALNASLSSLAAALT